MSATRYDLLTFFKLLVRKRNAPLLAPQQRGAREYILDSIRLRWYRKLPLLAQTVLCSVDRRIARPSFFPRIISC